jgi:imidazoleglycerol phosphate synthase glutamine amidotransferase subunit HisH
LPKRGSKDRDYIKIVKKNYVKIPEMAWNYIEAAKNVANLCQFVSEDSTFWFLF